MPPLSRVDLSAQKATEKQRAKLQHITKHYHTETKRYKMDEIRTKTAVFIERMFEK